MAHPHYHRLLAAYANCQKVGAPPEVVARLEEACASAMATAGGATGSGNIGEDPALDQFMEAYCEMLTKYEQELSKPFKETMLFLQRVESQFKALTVSSSNSGICADIAVSKHEYWSAFAPLPFEVVVSAGQKAKEEAWDRGGGDLTGEGNIESMLSVEMGLRELASLKI